MLVEMAVLSVVLSREPDRCGIGERVVSVNSQNLELVLGEKEWPHPQIDVGIDLEHSIARDFSFLPEVQCIMTEHADGNLLVWIGLDNPSREVRERIFDKELSLIDAFPDIDFDFNIVPAGRDPRQLASTAKMVYLREASQSADKG